MQSRRNRILFFPRRIRWLPEAVAVVVVIVLVALVGPARAGGALEQAMGSVFTVHSADAEDRFLGSAFLWGDGAVAVTNAHVVGDAGTVRLTDAQGREEIGQVIARDAVRDVAVISVQPGRRGLPLGDAPGLGAEVWALGAPLGIAFTLTGGLVSALARQVDVAVPLRLLQHDAAVNPGSSGGPLVDGAGRLVGMNSQIADGSRMYVGVAYAIGAADLARIVTGLVDETLAPYPVLGMTGRAVDRQVAAALSVPMGGVLVDAVDAGGVARDLRAGDVIGAVDGVPLLRAGDLAFAVEAAQARGAAELTVTRDGATVAVSVDLALPDAVLGLREIEGAVVQRVTAYTLETLGIGLGEGGVVVTVSHNSPALGAGVVVGDAVLMLNGAAMNGAGLRAAVIDGPALLLLRGADGRTRHVMVDPWAKAAGFRPVGGANVLDPDVVVF